MECSLLCAVAACEFAQCYLYLSFPCEAIQSVVEEVFRSIISKHWCLDEKPRTQTYNHILICYGYHVSIYLSTHAEKRWAVITLESCFCPSDQCKSSWFSLLNLVLVLHILHKQKVYLSLFAKNSCLLLLEKALMTIIRLNHLCAVKPKQWTKRVKARWGIICYLINC